MIPKNLKRYFSVILCGDGILICSSLKCDGSKDCTDESDELGCNERESNDNKDKEIENRSTGRPFMCFHYKFLHFHICIERYVAIFGTLMHHSQ